MTTPTSNISNLTVEINLIPLLAKDETGSYVLVISYDAKRKALIGSIGSELTLKRDNVEFDSSIVDGVNTGAKIYINAQTGGVDSVIGVAPKTVNPDNKRAGCMRQTLSDKSF